MELTHMYEDIIDADNVSNVISVPDMYKLEYLGDGCAFMELATYRNGLCVIDVLVGPFNSILVILSLKKLRKVKNQLLINSPSK